MSGAVQFFNQLQEDDTEVMKNFEGEIIPEVEVVAEQEEVTEVKKSPSPPAQQLLPTILI